MRARLRAALVAASVAATLITGTASAAADPPTVDYLRVQQWNIAGAVVNPFDGEKPDNEGTFDVVRRLVDRAETFYPHLITLNEACRLQARYVARNVPSALGRVDWHLTPTESESGVGDALRQFWCAAGGTGLDGDSGPAIVAVGASDVWEKRSYYFTEDARITSDPTPYGVACMTVSFVSPERTVRACSGHLHKDHPIGAAQAQVLANVLSEQPYPVVLAGDLNATPDLLGAVYAPAQDGTGDYLEVDHPQNEGTFRNGDKYDYIFGDQRNFVAEGAEVVDGGICPSWPYDHPCSDHKMLLGKLIFRDDVPAPPPPGGDPLPAGEPFPVDSPPVVTAGPDVSGDEGSSPALSGSADDDSGPPSLTWSYQPVSGVDAGAACTFSDPHRARTRITCTDDGVYRATLTASDGANGPVADSARVTIRNVAPTLSLSAPAAWQVFRARTAVDLSASFTDPGANDTHTCRISWDDGTASSAAAQGSSCSGAHTFARAGMYSMKVTVTDDDGGSDSGEVMVVVYDPEGPFANVDGSLASSTGAWQQDGGVTGELWSNLVARYYGASATRPTGTLKSWLTGTGLRFEGGDRGLEWLVVTPDGKVAARATGTLQGGSARYGMLLYGADGPDTGRVVVWPLADGADPPATPWYDSRRGQSYDVDDATLGGLLSGTVTIHPPTPLG